MADRSVSLSPARSATADRAAHVACDVKMVLGESPLWDEASGLHWLDLTGRRLCTMDRLGTTRSVALSRGVTAIELGSAADALCAVTASGFGRLDPRTGEVTEEVTVALGPGMTMNDAAVDARGRCWAGAATRDGARRSPLFRLAGGAASVQADGIGMSNGIDWSPDESVMYHADSTAGRVLAWRFDPAAGTVAAPRTLLTVPGGVGRPDGLTVDASGSVWLAVWGAGQVWQVSPADGRVLATVSVPTPLTTSCAFGGAALRTLYITTAARDGDARSGLLYAACGVARGCRPHRLAGPAS
jgi:sugar lactone lactonase YvrE